MNSSTNSKKSILPIAIAEGGSTAVSMGALWVMERTEGLHPIQNALAKYIIYPSLIKTAYPTPAEHQAAMAQANEQASVLVKGAGMLGAGFAAHIPLQLALEKKVDAKGFRTAVLGKGVGVATSLGTIIMLGQVAPSFLPKLQETLAPIISPFLPKDSKDDSRRNDEVAKLLILDLTSSAIAGLVNYGFSHKIR